jgi:hypothetical protein
MGDLAALKKESFISVEPHRVILKWNTTKTTRLNPHSFVLWTVIEDRSPERLAPIVNRVLAMRPGEKFTTTTAASFDRYTLQHNMPWTAHSFKRGALTHLMRAALDKKVPRQVVWFLAKHSDGWNQGVPESTLRYITDQQVIAMMTETWRATILL